ncbi:alpha-ribazole phosphatase [Fontibacillus solani]|uniref:Alpha-ribazole phosphatase n=1 Tax=Fontibacillus solani TaxID=1572857 RepID=A0A7W3STH7_9BACL|nr:histidine phosphatase family protein [Fontibacillus solani]MBA9085867.1 alpha-ribazole phosphatase [Fontibacillus solani]
MEWWLIRHGLTSWNVDRRYQGHSDVELLPNEKHGLEALSRKLKGVPFSAIYCSDLLRCRQTLKYVLPDLDTKGVHYDSRLREMNFGEWEGKTYDMLKDIPLYCSWIDQPKCYTPSGGESWQQFEGRVNEIYCELRDISLNSNDPVLIVTHGGVISMMATFMNSGSNFWEAARVEPGEVMKVTVPAISR